MLEEGTLEQLFSSIGHAPWPIVIGYVLISVVLIFRFLTEGRFKGSVEAWSSASSTMVFAVGAALAAGGVWWQVLVLGVFGMGASSFWRLVRKSIPVVGGAVFVLALLCTGCSGSQAHPSQSCIESIVECAANVGVRCGPELIEAVSDGDSDEDP